MGAALLSILSSVLPGVLGRVLPPEKASELDLAKLAQDLTTALLDKISGLVELEVKDRTSARELAIAEAAQGNALTLALSALVRPAWGFAILTLYGISWYKGIPISPDKLSIAELVIQFYFGGKIIEKIMPSIVAMAGPRR